MKNDAEIRVFFENGEKDLANVVIIREDNDTNESYRKRTKLFHMACVLGLLD